MACLIPSKWFIAVRIIGIALFLAGMAALLGPLVFPKEGESPFSKLGIKALLVLAGSSMAITGKWSDSEDSPSKAPTDSSNSQ